MAIFKCHNCLTRRVGKTAFEVWTYLAEERDLWGKSAVCDGKGHLTCYDCSTAYCNAREKAEARANQEQQPAPEDEDKQAANKLAETFDKVQATRVAHAAVYDFVPQEGDICVNFANSAANAPYVLFRYEGGLWKYHTQIQVGLLRYLEGYHRVVAFGCYEEGYYSQQPAPEQPKDGEDVAAEARPGDIVVYTNDNDQEQEGVYVRPDPSGRGIMVSHSGIEVAVKYRQINGLKKAEAAPASSDQPAPEDEEEPPHVAEFARQSEAEGERYLENRGRSDNQVWIDDRHTEPAPYEYVAITRAQQPLAIPAPADQQQFIQDMFTTPYQSLYLAVPPSTVLVIPMPASFTEDVPVPDQTPEQVAALAGWLKSHDYSRIRHSILFQYEGSLKTGAIYTLEPHYGSGLMVKCGDSPMDIRAYVPLEHIVKIYIDPAAFLRVESEYKRGYDTGKDQGDLYRTNDPSVDVPLKRMLARLHRSTEDISDYYHDFYVGMRDGFLAGLLADIPESAREQVQALYDQSSGFNSHQEIYKKLLADQQ